MEKVYVYCDGGCRGNGKKKNIGGWGVYLVYKGQAKCLCGGTKNTTNNAMELTSCVKGLESLKRKDLPVEVVMDSAYVINGITKWIFSWVRNGWMTSKKEPIENKALWQTLYELKKSFKSIEFTKVKGHASNVGNNKADELANKAMDDLDEMP